MGLFSQLFTLYEKATGVFVSEELDLAFVESWLASRTAARDDVRERLLNHRLDTRSWDFWGGLLIESVVSSLVFCIVLGVATSLVWPSVSGFSAAALVCTLIVAIAVAIKTRSHVVAGQTLEAELRAVEAEFEASEELRRATRLMKAAEEYRRLVGLHKATAYATSAERNRAALVLQEHRRALQFAATVFEHGPEEPNAELKAIVEEAERAELMAAAWQEVEALCDGKDALWRELESLEAPVVAEQPSFLKRWVG